MKKRFLALLLAVLFVVALFSGCGGNTGNSGSSTDTGSGSTNNASASGADTGANAGSDTGADAGSDSAEPSAEPDAGQPASPYKLAADYATDSDGYPTDWYDYELPISTTDEVLSFWCHCFAGEVLGEDGYAGELYHQEVENRTGIHIEFVLSSWNERQTQFSVMQASDELPDILSQAGLFINGSKASNIAEGFFANIYDYKEYAPNYMYAIKTLSEKQPDLRDACIIAPEMIFEFVCLYDEALPSLAQVGIRNDWIEDMGLTLNDVKTVDQLHNVLTAFKSQYGCDYPWWMCNSVDNGSWFACYDVQTVLDNVYQTVFPGPSVKDGQARFYFSNDDARNFVTMINQWVSEGLVNPNWVSTDGGGTYDQDFTKGEVGTNPTYTNMLDYLNENTEDPNADWAVLPRTTLYEGQILHLGDDRSYYSTYNSGTSISARCENIPLAVTWCDWRYSPEGSFLGSYGVEGEMWHYNEQGVIMSDETMRADPNYMWFTVIKAANFQSEHCLKIQESSYAYEGGREIMEKSLEYYDTYVCDHTYQWPVGATLSDEQSNEFWKYAGDISTYIQENVIEFCNGDRPISQWDEYIETLNDMGLQEALNVYQGCYEDYKASRG